jgi:peptide/nickel transport system permease protein
MLFGIITLTFIIFRTMPGDPVEALMAARGRSSAAVYRVLIKQLGLDQPLIIQYLRYILELFSGQWGYSVSIAQNQPVWVLIFQRFPTSVDLAVFAMLIATYIGIKIGIVSAKHRNKVQDVVYRGLSFIGVSIPVFFMGMVLQYTLGYLFPIFPTVGFKDFTYRNPPVVTGFYIIDALLSGQIYLVVDYLYHLTLPVFCLAFITLAGIVRMTRSSMLEVLQQDYIRTARAKGCDEFDVIHTHALKNSMVSTITIIGLNFAGLITGTVLTEYTFAIPGIGQLLIMSVQLTDYWVLTAIIFLIGLIYIILNLIIDLAYAWLDPRIRY